MIISILLYYDQSRIILDARKAFDGLIPYSGLGANSTNDYFSSIDLIGGYYLKQMMIIVMSIYH